MAQGDDKRDKFVRLAEGRTQLALDAIRKLGNLSNRGIYEYSDADVKKIVKALRDATGEVGAKVRHDLRRRCRPVQALGSGNR